MADEFGSSQSQVQPKQFDPLGKNQVTGGPAMRAGVFGQLPTATGQAQAAGSATAEAAKAAAANHGFAAADKLATDQIAGKYLPGSPALDSAMATMRGAAGAEGQNNAARIKATYARNGQDFGTANQEALQSNQAATTAGANNTEAQARLQNYQAERQIQQSSPGMLESATTAPINYLSEVSNQYLAPLSQEAQIIAGLAGNGQIAQPDTVVTPGQFDQGLGALGSAL